MGVLPDNCLDWGEGQKVGMAAKMGRVLGENIGNLPVKLL